MRTIKFSKLNGQGNDFVLIDALKEDIILSGQEIARICDRHFGVGADGVILVRKSLKADLFMDYYNSDGSSAEMCGNGIRCMAKFAYDNHLINSDSVLIETRAGIKNINLKILKNNEIGEIQVDMGAPVFDSAKIPVDLNLLKNELNNSVKKSGKQLFSNSLTQTLKSDAYKNFVFNYFLKINRKNYNINCISMGNPHCVIFLRKNDNFDDINISDIGPKIENHPFFPKKTNVEFIKVENKEEISMMVWERGCGETLACGTGACASVVAAIVLGKVKPGSIRVNLKGGALNIMWNGSKLDSVFLKGTAELSFKGELFLN
ncbi:MAG: diaminopimelate epimerase [Actinobacteria bacterium]|nr:diaminopimelate epimerase [Actinomycetota bacterium]MCL6087515.1 diaminopimelate epimerase [Actinomycetota bacterium]